MPNKWTTFVKEWAAKNNTTYGCAMTKPECKEAYRKENPKPVKTARKRKTKVKASDVSYEKLEEAIPTESQAKKEIKLKIKELPKEEPRKVKVKRTKIDGTEYFIDNDNNLYNPSTKEHIGILDRQNNRIIPVDSEDEDEDEDEEEGAGISGKGNYCSRRRRVTPEERALMIERELLGLMRTNRIQPRMVNPVIAVPIDSQIQTAEVIPIDTNAEVEIREVANVVPNGRGISGKGNRGSRQRVAPEPETPPQNIPPRRDIAREQRDITFYTNAIINTAINNSRAIKDRISTGVISGRYTREEGIIMLDEIIATLEFMEEDLQFSDEVNRLRRQIEYLEQLKNNPPFVIDGGALKYEEGEDILGKGSWFSRQSEEEESPEDRENREYFRRFWLNSITDILNSRRMSNKQKRKQLRLMHRVMGRMIYRAEDRFIENEYRYLYKLTEDELRRLIGLDETPRAEEAEPIWEMDYLPLYNENQPTRADYRIERPLTAEPLTSDNAEAIDEIEANEVPTQPIVGGNALTDMFSLKKWGKYTAAIATGRNDYQPKAREIIKKYGNNKIVRMYACRNPVQKLLTAALNAVSFGQFNKNWEKQPYDTLFHLSLRVELDTKPQTTIAIEKTEAVTLTANPPPPNKSMECEFIPLNKSLTLNQLLQGGEAFMGDKYFKYSAKDNNCQDYIMGLLKGSNIGTQENYDFIKQDTKELFKGLPGTRKLSNTITDLGGVMNVVVEGAGVHKGENYYVQSVVFDKTKFNEEQAKDWIKKNNYVLKKADVTDTQIRFRQVGPAYIKKMGYTKFRTKKIGRNSGISLIISYK